MVNITTDLEYFEGIEYCKVGEIEHIYVFAHGWDVDWNGTIAGGLRFNEDKYEEDMEKSVIINRVQP